MLIRSATPRRTLSGGTQATSVFLRTHRVGRSVYLEAPESYRDPVTRKPKHHCIARWPADQPFAVVLAKARYTLGDVRESRGRTG